MPPKGKLKCLIEGKQARVRPGSYAGGIFRRRLYTERIFRRRRG